MTIRSSMWRRASHYFLGLALFVVIWWGGSLIVGPSVLPRPPAVAAYLRSPGVLAEFFRQVAKTAGRGLLGFSVAWMVALPLGILMGRFRTGERVGFFPLFLLQSAPPLFWVTPLVLWLGTKGMVAPAVAFLISLPLLTVHGMMAIKHIPDYEYDVFSVYASRPVVVALELYLPHLLPALKSNIHLGLLVSMKAAMLAEWFAAQDGFGQTIRIHYQFFAMTEFLGWALMFLLVIGGASFGLRTLLKWSLPQYRSTRASVDPAAPADSAPPAAPPRHDYAAAVLRVEELSFGYGRTPLFAGVCFQVTPRRPLVIHGESGCGKTTLLKCLAGILRPWEGTVAASGKVGLVFQQDALLDHRDALGNVLLPSMPRYSKNDVRRAQESLALWGLGNGEGMFPHELSGGMRKRVSMARAWFLDPGVLLLDEPFVNLDREARIALWQLVFYRIRESGLPTLIVTHYPEELRDFTVDIRPWPELARR